MYKECSLGKIVTCKEAFDRFLPGHADHYAHPENYRMAPFRIFGNLYYVGDKKVCLHLIDTGEGLILLDTGYGHEGDFLLENIRALGFRPEDIRYIIHTHGHFDHFGNTERLKALSGATVCMSAVDTGLLREDPRRALMHLGPDPTAEISWPDHEIEDGEHIRLGNTDITCLLAPGHTFGTLAFFFDVTDGEQTLRAGFIGGAGMLTIYKEYCRAYGMPQTKCQAMRQTIQKLWDQKVDITLGNHPPQNNTVGKREWWLEHPEKNPFINPDSWHIFLSELDDRCREFEALGY